MPGATPMQPSKSLAERCIPFLARVCWLLCCTPASSILRERSGHSLPHPLTLPLSRPLSPGRVGGVTDALPGRRPVGHGVTAGQWLRTVRQNFKYYISWGGGAHCVPVTAAGCMSFCSLVAEPNGRRRAWVEVGEVSERWTGAPLTHLRKQRLAPDDHRLLQHNDQWRERKSTEMCHCRLLHFRSMQLLYVSWLLLVKYLI